MGLFQQFSVNEETAKLRQTIGDIPHLHRELLGLF